MKKLVFFLLVIGMGALLFAQAPALTPQFVAGDWTTSDGRVFQNDTQIIAAKANIRVPQRGAMVYTFNVRYEKGAEDGHGGFGIHVFAKNPSTDGSWGSGQSYLLWLNYDKHPRDRGIPAGLSGQIYQSFSNSDMRLLRSVDLNKAMAPLLTPEYQHKIIRFTIWVDGNTGEVRVYDPTDATGKNYYRFMLPRRALPLRGDWVVVRTNGVSLSFAEERPAAPQQ